MTAGPLTGPTAGPLTGRSVVVTRSRAQSSDLVDRLASLGATVVELPVIAVEGPADGGRDLAVAAGQLAAGLYRWVAVTSPNAVAALVGALGDRTVPPDVRWAVVGAGTARSLADAGFTADLVPATAVSDALADEFPPAGPGAGPILFPRAESVRGALAPVLRAKGWRVDEVVAYRTVAGDPPPEAVEAAGRADAVAFTSSSTVERTVGLLGRSGVPPVVVSIGPVTSSSARALGLDVSAEARPHTIDGVVEAVLAALGPPGPPGTPGTSGADGAAEPGPDAG